MPAKTQKKPEKGCCGFLFGGIIATGKVVIMSSDNADPSEDYNDMIKLYGNGLRYKYVLCEDVGTMTDKFKEEMKNALINDSIYGGHIGPTTEILKKTSKETAAHNWPKITKKAKPETADDEPAKEPKKAAPKATAKKPPVAESDEEPEPTPKKPATKAAAKKPPVAESDDEEPPAKPAPKNAPKKK